MTRLVTGGRHGEGSPPGAARLLLVRHAESAWNVAGLRTGRADPPLSDAGARAAAAWAAALAANPAMRTGVSAVLSSPLLRCRQTAQAAGTALGLPVGPTVPGLVEQDQGSWTGLERAQIKLRWPVAWRSHPRQAPDAETELAVWDRVADALRALGAGWAGRQVLVVTHDRVLRTLAARLGGPGDPPAAVGHLGGWVVLASAAALALGPAIAAPGALPGAAGAEPAGDDLPAHDLPAHDLPGDEPAGAEPPGERGHDDDRPAAPHAATGRR